MSVFICVFIEKGLEEYGVVRILFLHKLWIHDMTLRNSAFQGDSPKLNHK